MRVVYGGAMKPAQSAPVLMVRYRCKRGHGEAVLDAYKGVPFCSGCHHPLEGVSIIHETRFRERPQDERLIEPPNAPRIPYEGARSDDDFFRGMEWDR